VVNLVQKTLDDCFDEANKRNPTHYDEIVQKVGERIKSKACFPIPQIGRVLREYFSEMPLTMRASMDPKRDGYVGYDQKTNTTVSCNCWDMGVLGHKISIWFTAREGDLSKSKTKDIEESPVYRGSKTFFYKNTVDVKY
jgi:hypothetical protein